MIIEKKMFDVIASLYEKSMKNRVIHFQTIKSNNIFNQYSLKETIKKF